MREVFEKSIRRGSNLQQVAIFVTNGRPTRPGDHVTALKEAVKEATAAKVNGGIKLFTVSYANIEDPLILNTVRSIASAPQYFYSASRVADLQAQISSRLATDMCRMQDDSIPLHIRTIASTSNLRPPTSTMSTVTARTTTLSGSSELLTNRTDGDYKINLCIKKGALCFTVPPSQGGGRGPTGDTGPAGPQGERGKYTKLQIYIVYYSRFDFTYFTFRGRIHCFTWIVLCKTSPFF